MTVLSEFSIPFASRILLINFVVISMVLDIKHDSQHL